MNPRNQSWYFSLFKQAIVEAFYKLSPKTLIKNPVMFLVELGSLLTTAVSIQYLVTKHFDQAIFSGQVSLWLWVTVLFANLAEAMAEGRGKAQAQALKQTRTETKARIQGEDGQVLIIPSSQLKKGDVVEVEATEIIPADGTVIEGVASVDESAITGESAPVIRQAGGDSSAVTGGTTVLSDRIVIEITTNPGESFLDRMISLVEGAVRQKTPNEIALNILLAGLTFIFLLVVMTLAPYSLYLSAPVSLVVLVALLVCLIPTTIGGLLSAIGIAGMDRLVQRNVLALSGRAVEAAGDVDVLLLDKTGTITIGNRMASEFIPAEGVSISELSEVSYLASLSDLTPEGRSIVEFSKKYGNFQVPTGSIEYIPFSAETRMSGTDVNGMQVRKGAKDAITRWSQISELKVSLEEAVTNISKAGGTPLLVAKNKKALGVIHLKDVIKPGIRDRFDRIRAMGIRTVMITGDNQLTAQTIAKEAGVDEFLAEAKPEDKLQLIKTYQNTGCMVAMSGDGTNDAPALAQSDVGLVMNTGTQAAREAGNMIDLDSDPTKLIEIVEIGKQLLITRGALTTFSIANDVSKYFAILPAMFMDKIPFLSKLNIMHLATPKSAILSAVIFNAVIIIFLIPLSLKGVHYRPQKPVSLLRRNLLIFGLGGLIFPFLGIKLIDMVINFLKLVS